jgi:YVTN family beta-propeller protein
VLLTIPVGPRPRSTTFLRDSSRAFIPSENGGSVDVIDTSTHALIARVPLSGELQRPMGGVASHDGKFVYMSTGRGKTVAIIDVEQNRHVGSIEAGDRPWGIAISTDDKWLFTANGPSHDVSIIDVSRRAVKARVKAGEGPWGALFLPALGGSR